MQAPKRIAVDFDGTLCNQEFPKIGAIKPYAREALELFRSLGFKIVIWSCRTCHWDYDVYGGNPGENPMERERVKEMVAWLDANGIPYDEVDDGSKGKLGADYYVDDKGIRFDDNWDQIMALIYAREKGIKLTVNQVAVLDEIAEANGFTVGMSGLLNSITLRPEPKENNDVRDNSSGFRESPEDSGGKRLQCR